MKRPHYLECRGEDWDKARMRALVRDDFTCQAHTLGLCEEPCQENRLRHLHVHHIVPRIQGGTHDLSNLLTLCTTHHIRLHPHMLYDLPQRERVLEADNDGYVKEL